MEVRIRRFVNNLKNKFEEIKMLTVCDDFSGKVYLTKREFKKAFFSYCVLW